MIILLLFIQLSIVSVYIATVKVILFCDLALSTMLLSQNYIVEVSKAMSTYKNTKIQLHPSVKGLLYQCHKCDKICIKVLTILLLVKLSVGNLTAFTFIPIQRF